MKVCVCVCMCVYVCVCALCAHVCVCVHICTEWNQNIIYYNTPFLVCIVMQHETYTTASLQSMEFRNHNLFVSSEAH